MKRLSHFMILPCLLLISCAGSIENFFPSSAREEYLGFSCRKMNPKTDMDYACTLYTDNTASFSFGETLFTWKDDSHN